jgi:hypothetical protein
MYFWILSRRAVRHFVWVILWYVDSLAGRGETADGRNSITAQYRSEPGASWLKQCVMCLPNAEGGEIMTTV